MIDKGLYKDKRLSKTEKKEIKPVNQGGGPNYLGKQETVTVPKKWLSDPDHVVAELAYITPREKKILLEKNLYGSLKGKPNRGPAGVQSLQGDMGSVGGGSSGGGGNSGGGGDAREQRRSEQYTSQTAKDLAAGVGSGGIGTLSDPREKMDYFGSTVFGPSRKYTGSFLDNILGKGYRAVQPYASDQFQSRLSQAGGFGKSIFGGILGLLNPVLGIAYKVGSSIPSMRNYDTLADYARGEFGLFQRPGVSVDQGRGSGLRPTGITEAVPPGMDLNDYEGYRDREYIESAPVNKGILDIIDYTDPYQGGTYN